MKKLFKTGLLATALASTLSFAALADDYAVIVNPNNAYAGNEETLKNEIRLLYLKQKFRWDNGQLSIPIGIIDSNPASAAFKSSILEMSDPQISAHWVRIKQLNGDPPPRKVSSERLITRLVARDAGSFGIVSKTTAEKSKDVKILFTF